MWPVFIRGVTDHLPNARITFDEFHVIAPASTAFDKARRLEQELDSSIKCLRWALLKDRIKLNTPQRTAPDTLQAATA
jgi:transposase